MSINIIMEKSAAAGMSTMTMDIIMKRNAAAGMSIIMVQTLHMKQDSSRRVR